MHLLALRLSLLRCRFLDVVVIQFQPLFSILLMLRTSILAFILFITRWANILLRICQEIRFGLTPLIADITRNGSGNFVIGCLVDNVMLLHSLQNLPFAFQPLVKRHSISLANQNGTTFRVTSIGRNLGLALKDEDPFLAGIEKWKCFAALGIPFAPFLGLVREFLGHLIRWNDGNELVHDTQR